MNSRTQRKKNESKFFVPLDDEADVNIYCFAMLKAMAYECENAEYFLNLTEAERKEEAQNFILSIRFYEREYSRLIDNALRERRKHTGGIYRKAYADMERGHRNDISKLAQKTIQMIEKNTPTE